MCSGWLAADRWRQRATTVPGCAAAKADCAASGPAEVEACRVTQGGAAREDGGVPAAARAYDREDAARAPAAGEGVQGDDGGLPVPDEVGKEG